MLEMKVKTIKTKLDQVTNLRALKTRYYAMFFFKMMLEILFHGCTKKSLLGYYYYFPSISPFFSNADYLFRLRHFTSLGLISLQIMVLFHRVYTSLGLPFFRLWLLMGSLFYRPNSFVCENSLQ